MRLLTYAIAACGLIGAPALAQGQTPVDCPQTVSSKDYLEGGGRLAAVGSHNHIYNCGNFPDPDCHGQITGTGLIDMQGNVHNLQVVSDDFPPQYQKRLEAEWLDTTSRYRYEPPVLNGKPVCIQMPYAMRVQQRSW